jgi:hypothetical protein
VLTNADSGDGSLRAAIATAQSGDQIIFADSLRGQTITLASGDLAISQNLDIEGSGADQLAISGDHASRVFEISGGVTVTVAGLTITDGLASNSAGIRNVGSSLTVANDVFSNNEVEAPGGGGGAISSVSGANLTVTHCVFLHNQAISNNAALAGAINTQGSIANVTDSTFLANQVIGGDNGTIGFARGGAIYNAFGSLTVVNSTFTDNQALGGSNNTGPAGTFGNGSGGAIQNSEQGIMFLSGCLFSANRAIGGSHNTSTGGSGSVSTGGGGALINVGVATVTDTLFEDNEALGGSSNTGFGTSFQFVGMAFGGAIYTTAGNTGGDAVTLTLHNVTLRNNRALGGDGNTAGTFVGEGIGGGLASNGSDMLLPTSGGSTTTLNDCRVADNQAIGGQGADSDSGRDALGGGIANVFGGIVTVSGSTCASDCQCPRPASPEPGVPRSS